LRDAFGVGTHKFKRKEIEAFLFTIYNAEKFRYSIKYKEFLHSIESAERFVSGEYPESPGDFLKITYKKDERIIMERLEEIKPKGTMIFYIDLPPNITEIFLEYIKKKEPKKVILEKPKVEEDQIEEEIIEQMVLTDKIKPNQFNLRNLFKENQKLTFLIGAGCSVDPPSCLPAGRSMIKAITNYACAESEIEKIIDLKELRFEQLVEIIRDNLDPELKLIDYYGQCDTPNLQHFFLADMIKKGHFVMTTNFDFLIEYALLKSNVPENEIIPVITKKDFEEYNNPNKLFEKGKKTVYKIHGSTKNIITKEITKDSLIATIRAFGSGKEGENIFQVEPFKRPLFDNISNDRSLIIIGYSGSDDFDIIPTLKVLKNLRRIIWIYYSKEFRMGNERITKIDAFTPQMLDKLDNKRRKVTKYLFEIWQRNNAVQVFRVDIDTSDMVKEIITIKPNLSHIYFDKNLENWIHGHIRAPSDIEMYYIPHEIYYQLDKFDDSLRCAKEMKKISQTLKDPYWSVLALNNIGRIYYDQGDHVKALNCYEEALQFTNINQISLGRAAILDGIGNIFQDQGKYSEALKRYEKALQILDHLKDLGGKANILKDIGMIHMKQENYIKALELFTEALQIDESLGNISKKASHLNNIGVIYKSQRKYNEALEFFQQALQIAVELSDQSGKGARLNNIGLIYSEKKDYSKALEYFKEALKIAEDLHILSGESNTLINIGTIYFEQSNYLDALELYEKALQIYEQLGDQSGKSNVLNSLGLISKTQGNYTKALEYFKEALQIDEQHNNLRVKVITLNNIGMIYHEQGYFLNAMKQYEKLIQVQEEIKDQKGLANCLNNMGQIYQEQKDYKKALEFFQHALQIDEQQNNLLGKAYSLNNIGKLYFRQGEYSKALKQFKQALQIDVQLDNLQGKATRLNNIGNIYLELENYPKALEYFEEALQIDVQLNNLKGKAARTHNIGMVYELQGYFSEALKKQEQAVQILTKLGLGNSPNAKMIKDIIEHLKYMLK